VEKNKELFTATDWQVLLFAIKTMTVVHTKAQSQNSQSNQIKSNRDSGKRGVYQVDWHVHKKVRRHYFQHLYRILEGEIIVRVEERENKNVT
jgi:hypothetical protein